MGSNLAKQSYPISSNYQDSPDAIEELIDDFQIIEAEEVDEIEEFRYHDAGVIPENHDKWSYFLDILLGQLETKKVEEAEEIDFIEQYRYQMLGIILEKHDTWWLQNWKTE